MTRIDGILRGAAGVRRCWWCGDDAQYRRYHDREWGRPVTDDRRLFETLCLEGFQSGLSWLTILRKRANSRAAFREFDVDAVARFNVRSVARLLADAGIVRHRGKIESVLHNAKRARALQAEYGSLGAYVWQFVPPVAERPRRMTKAALLRLASTPTSTALSRDLKQRGWRYVGPTTVYAFMQAVGLVNDHLAGCDARAQVEAARRRLRRPLPDSTRGD